MQNSRHLIVFREELGAITLTWATHLSRKLKSAKSWRHCIFLLPLQKRRILYGKIKARLLNRDSWFLKTWSAVFILWVLKQLLDWIKALGQSLCRLGLEQRPSSPTIYEWPFCDGKSFRSTFFVCASFISKKRQKVIRDLLVALRMYVIELEK